MRKVARYTYMGGQQQEEKSKRRAAVAQSSKGIDHHSSRSWWIETIMKRMALLRETRWRRGLADFLSTVSSPGTLPPPPSFEFILSWLSNGDVTFSPIHILPLYYLFYFFVCVFFFFISSFSLWTSKKILAKGNVKSLPAKQLVPLLLFVGPSSILIL